MKQHDEVGRQSNIKLVVMGICILKSHQVLVEEPNRWTSPTCRAWKVQNGCVLKFRKFGKLKSLFLIPYSWFFLKSAITIFLAPRHRIFTIPRRMWHKPCEPFGGFNFLVLWQSLVRFFLPCCLGSEKDLWGVLQTISVGCQQWMFDILLLDCITRISAV